MDYLNLLEIKQNIKSLKRINDYFFNNVTFNYFRIDFYAGTGALCRPNSTLDNLLFYETIQLSITEIIKEDQNIIRPPEDDRFRNFIWSKYFNYIDSNGKVKPSYMADNIPAEEACQLIRDVYKISRLTIFY
jgi:hypothetical protein